MSYANSTITCASGGPSHGVWPYDQILYGLQHDDLAHAARTLGLAYQFDGDPRAARAAWDILLAYGARYETYEWHNRHEPCCGAAHWPSVGGRVHSEDMQEAAWLATMAAAYDYVRAAAPDARAAGLVERGLLRAGADLLRAKDSVLNHRSVENEGLVALGLALRDFVMVRFAVDDPAGGARAQLQRDVLPGGLWVEGSFVYHMVALDPLVRTAVRLQRGLGVDLWAAEGGALREMVLLPARVALPDGLLPPVNDALLRWLRGYWRTLELAFPAVRDPRVAAALAPERARPDNVDGLLFGAGDLGAAAAPAGESLLLPEAGFAVLRRGAGGDPRYALLDFGPHGGWHGHPDKLGLLTYGHGALRGLDPGTVGYSIPSHHTWDKTTVAHNTLVLDQQNQVSCGLYAGSQNTITRTNAFVSVLIFFIKKKVHGITAKKKNT